MNPYVDLDSRYYWAPAVGRIPATEISLLWNPKRDISRRHKIATYGSCFAQHFGRALAARKYKWMQCEEPPAGLSQDSQRNYNYGTFSSRTGNIYTASLLKQWVEWSLGISQAPEEIWETDGRFYDPFRPNVEPNGFESEAELLNSREITLEAFKKSITDANLFVFTLGLTESWINADGYEYPMCPGTIAGEFNAQQHIFKNHEYSGICQDLKHATSLMRKVNPRIRFLLTVSPVPLTATMSGNHVLTATVESKSILRAVAGKMAKSSSIFDYFPSYEIICSAPFQGMFYNDNKRTVKQEGVNFVMSSFFDCLEYKFRPEVYEKKTSTVVTSSIADNDEKSEAVCEEELLSAFMSK